MDINQNVIGDLDAFINLIRATCEEPQMKQTLTTILSMSDNDRKAVVVKLVDNMKSKGADEKLVASFSALSDDRVADMTMKIIQGEIS